MTGDDVVLQNGMAKSGNYWLYSCIQALLAEAGVPMRSYIQNHKIYDDAKTWTLSFPEQASIDVIDVTSKGYFTQISSRFSEVIPDLDAYFGQVRHLWSHALYRGALSDAVYERCKAVFYIVRDPRDALLSQADFMFSDYGRTYLKPSAPDRETFISERLQSYPGHWRTHVGAHLDASASLPITFVLYEDMKTDLPGELGRMAVAMDLPPVTRARCEEIAEGLGFSAMKARSDSAHLNKGRSGRWRDVLTLDQQEWFHTAAGDVMERLGYSEV